LGDGGGRIGLLLIMRIEKDFINNIVYMFTNTYGVFTLHPNKVKMLVFLINIFVFVTF
jgi:hypothetical protein